MDRPQAPRFRAYFEHIEQRPVLHMSRSQWDQIASASSDPILIDVSRTPMGGVSSQASVVAAYAQRYSTATSELGIVRMDIKDAPKPYNVDKYTVWEDIPSHRSFREIVRAASTEDNQNLRSYLAANVFFVKRDPDSEHHSAAPPPVVTLLLEGESR